MEPCTCKNIGMHTIFFKITTSLTMKKLSGNPLWMEKQRILTTHLANKTMSINPRNLCKIQFIVPEYQQTLCTLYINYQLKENNSWKMSIQIIWALSATTKIKTINHLLTCDQSTEKKKNKIIQDSELELFRLKIDQ